MNETTILQRIRLAVGRVSGLRLFRNNCGQAWMGKIIRRTADTITIKDPRPVQFGLNPGSADLIGWRTIMITPDMIGKSVAVFASIEVKTDNGRVKPEQQNWLEQVEKAGGLAVIARSPEQAAEFFKNH